MKFMMTVMMMISGAMASASTLENCFPAAGKAAFAEALNEQGAGLSAGFRAIRLGSDGSQGKDAEKGSPFQIRGRAIIVIVTTSMAMNPTDSQDQEVVSSEFYRVPVLDAKACRLGPASNVTPE